MLYYLVYNSSIYENHPFGQRNSEILNMMMLIYSIIYLFFWYYLHDYLNIVSWLLVLDITFAYFIEARFNHKSIFGHRDFNKISGKNEYLG